MDADEMSAVTAILTITLCDRHAVLSLTFQPGEELQLFVEMSHHKSTNMYSTVVVVVAFGIIVTLLLQSQNRKQHMLSRGRKSKFQQEQIESELSIDHSPLRCLRLLSQIKSFGIIKF